jgi:hypothetical protein
VGAAVIDGQHEGERPDQVRGDSIQQRAALHVRLANQTQVPHLQVAKAAMDQLGGGAGGGAAEVAGVEQGDRGA